MSERFTLEPFPAIVDDKLKGFGNWTHRQFERIRDVFPRGLWAPGIVFPSNPSNGDIFFETDTKILWIYDSANARWDPVGGLKPYVRSGGAGTGNTTSTTYVDMPGAPEVTFTKYAAHTDLYLLFETSNYMTITANFLTAFALRINSVDYDVGHFFFNNLSVHHASSGMNISAAGLVPGAYTARGRWKVTGGTANQDTNDYVRISVTECLP